MNDGSGKKLNVIRWFSIALERLLCGLFAVELATNGIL